MAEPGWCTFIATTDRGILVATAASIHIASVWCLRAILARRVRGRKQAYESFPLGRGWLVRADAGGGQVNTGVIAAVRFVRDSLQTKREGRTMCFRVGV